MMAARNQQPGDDGRHAERGSQFRRTSLVRATDFPSLGQAFRRHEVKCTCCFAEELIRVCRESISRVGGQRKLQYSAETGTQSEVYMQSFGIFRDDIPSGLMLDSAPCVSWESILAVKLPAGESSKAMVTAVSIISSSSARSDYRRRQVSRRAF